MPFDQILVALIVAGAAIYLGLRVRRANQKSCGDSCGCSVKKAEPPVESHSVKL